jgi:hypothetical protein
MYLCGVVCDLTYCLRVGSEDETPQRFSYGLEAVEGGLELARAFNGTKTRRCAIIFFFIILLVVGGVLFILPVFLAVWLKQLWCVSWFFNAVWLCSIQRGKIESELRAQCARAAIGSTATAVYFWIRN